MRNNNRVLIPKANFRDIGGIENHEGKTIQLGQIFRSGHLCELASSEKTILIAVINNQNQKRYIGVKLK